jgi:response regulator RpfG family c-di-GMP phosphodiesterase
VQFFKKIKDEYPKPVRMLLTGYADIEAVIEAINEGHVYRYITKPWDPDELIQTLQAAAEEYARRKRRRELFGEVKSFLDETLNSNDDLASAPCNGEFRERGENLRSQIEHEIEVYDAPA